MLRFKHFINEEYLTEEIDDSDTKGKLHELLVARHLSDTDDNEHKKHLPTHFRNEKTQLTPEQLHSKIKDSISDEDYKGADDRARDAANAIRSHLKDKHGIDAHHIKGAFWTSNKSDHKKLVNHILHKVEQDPNASFKDTEGNEINRENVHKYETDANSNADAMIHVVRHFDAKGKPIHPDEYKPELGHKAVHTLHGVSLKVGSAKPNLANPGIESLDRLTGASSGGAQKYIDEHSKKLKELGFDEGTQNKNHAKYKKQRDSSNPVENENAKNADASKLSTLYKMSKHYTDAINNLPTHKVHHLLTTLMGAPTTHHHFKAWAQTFKPTAKKQKPSVQHVSNHIEDLHNELAKHTNGFHAVMKGQTIHIHAKPLDWKEGDPLIDSKGNAVGKRIGSIGLKGGNGPTKGFNGTVTSHVN